MREALKKLGSESAVYGLGQAGSRAVQLLLVPVLTRALAPEAFGVAELVQGYAQSAVLLLVFGMDGALARFFYREQDHEARVRMVSTSFLFRLGVAAAAVLIGVALVGPLAPRLAGGGDHRRELVIGVASLPFTLLVLFANDVLRVTFQPWKFIALNVAQTVLVTAFALYLVIGRDLGAAGVLAGRLLGDACAALIGLVLIRHSLRPRFSREALSRMLAYGVPTLPALAAFGMMASMDRWALQRFRSLEELAHYAVALKFFTLVTFAASAFQLAYGPFAYARAGTPEAPRLFARVLDLYAVLATLGALLTGLFAPELLRLLAPPEYHVAAGPALLLAFAAAAFGAYTVTAIGIGIALETPLLGLCAGGAALVTIVAQLVLVPRFGAVGAAWATLLGYVTSAILTYVVAQRVHPLPYRGGVLLLWFASALAAGLAASGLAGADAIGHAVRWGTVAVWAGIAAVLVVRKP